MWNDASNNKKVVCIIIFFLLVFLFSLNTNTQFAHAETGDVEQELSETTDEILDNIETDSLDEFLNEESFIDYFSFKEFAIDVLNGKYLTDYNSVFDFFVDSISQNFRQNMRFFACLFVCVVLFELFKCFCENKYFEVKKSVKIVFCFLFCVIILSSFKSFYETVSLFVDRVFNFVSVLFPILVGLITMSGSVASASVYSSFSVFILSTGAYIIKYILMPVSISIFIFSLFGAVMKNKKFDKVCDVAKLVFKYTVVLFFSVFGILSLVNVVSASSRDGLNMKLTKYAIKNYVPILGGYISEGFDFIKSCSVLIKNAFGVCSVLILFSMVISPLVLSVVFIFGFKILAAVTGYVGDGVFADMFSDVSKAYSNFLTVLIGLFLIMFVFIFLLIMSVWVV